MNTCDTYKKNVSSLQLFVKIYINVIFQKQPKYADSQVTMQGFKRFSGQTYNYRLKGPH